MIEACYFHGCGSNFCLLKLKNLKTFWLLTLSVSTFSGTATFWVHCKASVQPTCTLTGGSVAPHGPATAEEQGDSFQELVEQGY